MKSGRRIRNAHSWNMAVVHSHRIVSFDCGTAQLAYCDVTIATDSLAKMRTVIDNVKRGATDAMKGADELCAVVASWITVNAMDVANVVGGAATEIDRVRAFRQWLDASPVSLMALGA